MHLRASWSEDGSVEPLDAVPRHSKRQSRTLTTDLTDIPVQKRLAVLWNLSRIVLVLLSTYHVGHGLLAATAATRILSNAGSAYEATLPPPSLEQRVQQAEAAHDFLHQSSDGLGWLFLLFAAALTPYARIRADERRKPNDNGRQKHECEPS